MEGLGVGFMDFLDDIQNKINRPLEKKNYDFEDDDKEVLIDENDLVQDSED